MQKYLIYFVGRCGTPSPYTYKARFIPRTRLVSETLLHVYTILCTFDILENF